ncbi:AMP-binding protein [Brucella abortus]|nr:AMP-binding protein [Brucella abortus]
MPKPMPHGRTILEGFWADAAAAMELVQAVEQVFAGGEGTYGRWYTGAECNTCYNALDRHVANGRGDQLALICESPITGRTRKITYHELLEEVEALAAVMLDNGVQKGDRILIYMPTVPEALVAMLASARIGAIHSVVFGGFAANELATRIDDAKPVMIIAASCGIEPSRVVPYQAMLDKAISLAHHKVDHCIIFQRGLAPAFAGGRTRHRLSRSGRCRSWTPCALRAGGRDRPARVLYTSGTTGEPKGVVRDNGGHMVALVWSMKHVFDVKPGQVWWAASDVGWVVGHSYIVYAPLLIGATSILFEGKPVGTPDAGEYWRIIEEHGVEVMFTAPTALRAIKKEDADGHFVRRHDLSGFRALLSCRRTRRPGHDPLGGKPARLPGHRPLVADRKRLADGRQSARPRPSGNQIRLACRLPRRAMTFACWMMRATRSNPARWAIFSSRCLCRPVACQHCGTPMSVSARPISTSFRAITKPPMRAIWMRTAISTL